MGHGTAWGGRLPCKEDIRWVQIPHGPPYTGVAQSGRALPLEGEVSGSNPFAGILVNGSFIIVFSPTN